MGGKIVRMACTIGENKMSKKFTSKPDVFATANYEDVFHPGRSFNQSSYGGGFFNATSMTSPSRRSMTPGVGLAF